MGVHNIRLSLRGKVLVLQWSGGGAVHTMKRGVAHRDTDTVLTAANKLLETMEADPDGSRMLEAGKEL